MTQHHYTVWIGDEGKPETLLEQVEGGVDITPYTTSASFRLSPDSAEALKAFNAGLFAEPPTYDVIVDTDPEPKPPTPPEHIPGFWAWLTGKNEKLWNDYLDEYDAYQEEWDQWLERRANNVISNRQVFHNVRIEGGEA